MGAQGTQDTTALVRDLEHMPASMQGHAIAELKARLDELTGGNTPEFSKPAMARGKHSVMPDSPPRLEVAISEAHGVADRLERCVAELLDKLNRLQGSRPLPGEATNGEKGLDVLPTLDQVDRAICRIRRAVGDFEELLRERVAAL